MPFAKISEKRLAKTISIAVSGFCLLSLSYYFMCHVTDIYLMHCIMISTIAVQYMVIINHKSPTSTVSMFQTISMMEPSIIVNKHRFCR